MRTVDNLNVSDPSAFEARYKLRKQYRCRSGALFAFAIVALLSAAPLKAMAANSLAMAGEPMSIESAVQAALRNSDEWAIALKQVDVDDRRTGVAAAGRMPSVSADASASAYDTATRASLAPSLPTIELLGPTSQVASVEIVQPLDLSGQVSAAVRAARYQQAMDELHARQTRNDVALRAETAYYSVLRAQHEVGLAQSNLAAASGQQSLAEKMVEAGTGQKIDLRRADSQVAGATQDLSRAENNLDIAAQDLNDLIGRPLDSPVSLQDISGVADADASLTPHPLYSAPDPAAATPDIEKLLARAHANNPDLLSASIAVDAAKVGVTLARADLEPRLSVSAAGSYFPTTSFDSPLRRTADVAITLSVPLYDGGLTRDRVAAADIESEQAKLALDRARRSSDLAVRQAFLNLDSAAGQISAANTQLIEAITARKLAQTRFEGQVGLYLEVTDAQSALVAAETNQVNSVYDYLIARAQLEYAVGDAPGIGPVPNFEAAK